MSIHGLIQRADARLAALERLLVIAITAGLAGVMMAQVVLRYFFDAPLFWAEEVAVQLLVFMTLIGLSLLARAETLVSIELLPQALKGRRRHLLQLALGGGFLALCIFVAWLGLEWISRSDVRLDIGATLRLPRWYNYSVLPGAMILMAFHQFAAMLRHLHAVLVGAAA